MAERADTRPQKNVLNAQGQVAGLSQRTIGELCAAYEMGITAPHARVIAEVSSYEQEGGIVVFTDTVSMAEGEDPMSVVEPTPLYTEIRTAPGVCNGVRVRRKVGDIEL